MSPKVGGLVWMNSVEAVMKNGVNKVSVPCWKKKKKISTICWLALDPFLNFDKGRILTRPRYSNSNNPNSLS